MSYHVSLYVCVHRNLYGSVSCIIKLWLLNVFFSFFIFYLSELLGETQKYNNPKNIVLKKPIPLFVQSTFFFFFFF